MFAKSGLIFGLGLAALMLPVEVFILHGYDQAACERFGCPTDLSRWSWDAAASMYGFAALISAVMFVCGAAAHWLGGRVTNLVGCFAVLTLGSTGLPFVVMSVFFGLWTALWVGPAGFLKGAGVALFVGLREFGALALAVAVLWTTLYFALSRPRHGT